MYNTPNTRATSMSKRTIASTTDYTSAFNSVSGFLTVPGDFVEHDGATFRGTMIAGYKTKAAPAGDIYVKMTAFGQDVSEVSFSPAASIGAFAYMEVQFLFTLQSLGSAATYRCATDLVYWDGSPSNFRHVTEFADGTCDTTADDDMDMFARYTTSDASNTMTVYAALIEEFLT